MHLCFNPATMYFLIWNKKTIVKPYSLNLNVFVASIKRIHLVITDSLFSPTLSPLYHPFTTQSQSNPIPLLLLTKSTCLIIMPPLPKLSITEDDVIIEIDPESNASSPSSDSTASREEQIALRKAAHKQFIMALRPLPLQYTWTIWFDKNNNSTDYESRLYVLQDDVDNIGLFYQVYNNYPWDRIAMRDSVHIFRKGIKPMWEDPFNVQGGCWRFRVPKGKAQEFFHEVAILCLASEFQAAIGDGMYFLFHPLLDMPFDC